MTGPLGRLSLEQLAESALEEELIDRIDITGTVVTIVQGDRTFRMPRKQAATFLIGMLRGRSWFVTARSHDDAGGRPDAEDDPGPVGEVRQDEDADLQRRDAAIDALLPLTREIGIIKGYQVRERNRTVRIDIWACSSVFTYLDAVRYLLDCLQDEFRSMPVHE